MRNIIGKVTVTASTPASPRPDPSIDPAGKSPVPSPLNDLPHHLKSLIASRLDQDSSKALRLTNKSFGHVGAERITKLTIPAGEVGTLEKLLRGLPFVRNVTITDLDDVGLAQLARMPLETRNKISNISLRANITDAGLVPLQDLMRLQSLELVWCSNITNLAPLQGLTKLQSLNLAGCDGITDANIASLQGLTQLQSLNLGFCPKFTDDALAHLRAVLRNCHI